MSNAEILSRGHKIYSKKRKEKKEQIPEIVFDPENRREFLTGFHKRKVERHNVAVEKAKARERQERIENRKTHREQIANAAKAKVEAYHEFIKRNMPEAEPDSGSDSDDDAASDSNDKKISEFRTPETLTTVTVVEEMDDEFGFGGIVEDKKKKFEDGNEPKKEIAKEIKEEKKETKSQKPKFRKTSVKRQKPKGKPARGVEKRGKATRGRGKKR